MAPGSGNLRARRNSGPPNSLNGVVPPTRRAGVHVVAAARVQVEQLRARAENAEYELQELREEHDELREQHDQLREQHDQLRAQQSALQRQLDYIMSQIGMPPPSWFHVEDMKGIFSNVDIAIEILSRLPIESSNDLKSVCKRWCVLLSHPSFCSAHFRRSTKTNSGIFVQAAYHCKYCQNNLDFGANGYISIGKEGRHATSENILDFLPEKVVVLASCSGLLLCRNILDMFESDHCYHKNMLDYYPKEVVLYVCNPFTKEWATLKPRGKYENTCCYGFAYEPFGTAVAPNFVIVMVLPPLKLGKDPHLFQIYCSKRGTWRTAKEVCTLSDRLVIRQGYFTKGVFYWLTTGHSILAFDLKMERCQVIKLPDNAMDEEENLGLCFGVSEGSLHYIRCNRVELTVWVLKNNNLLRPQQWVRKHSKPQLEMNHEFVGAMDSRRFPDDHEQPNRYIDPCAFQDDIVFMRVHWDMCTYNIKTGDFEDKLCSLQKLDSSLFSFQSPAVFPYCKSILRVQVKD